MELLIPISHFCAELKICHHHKFHKLPTNQLLNLKIQWKTPYSEFASQHTKERMKKKNPAKQTRIQWIPIWKNREIKSPNWRKCTIRSQRSASDCRKLLASIDVFENSFVEAREMFVPFFKHRLYSERLHWEPHFWIPCFVLWYKKKP